MRRFESYRSRYHLDREPSVELGLSHSKYEILTSGLPNGPWGENRTHLRERCRFTADFATLAVPTDSCVSVETGYRSCRFIIASLSRGRGRRIRTFDLLVPNQASTPNWTAPRERGA